MYFLQFSTYCGIEIPVSVTPLLSFEGDKNQKNGMIIPENIYSQNEKKHYMKIQNWDSRDKVCGNNFIKAGLDLIFQISMYILVFPS